MTMHRKSTIALCCLLLFFNSCEAMVFSRCQFVHQLRKHYVPEWQVPTLTCIANWESSFDTGKLDYELGRHGVFQIGEKLWCTPFDYPGRQCRRTCSSFRDDFLGDDIACALQIYEETKDISGVGYDAWEVYWNHCAGDTMKYVRGC